MESRSGISTAPLGLGLKSTQQLPQSLQRPDCLCEFTFYGGSLSPRQGKRTKFYACISGSLVSLEMISGKPLLSKYLSTNKEKALFSSSLKSLRNANRSSYIGPPRINYNKKFLIKEISYIIIRTVLSPGQWSS